MLAVALERAPEPIAIARVREPGSAPEIVFVNAAFAKAFKYDADDLVGKRLSILAGPNTDAARFARLIAAIERGRAASEIMSLYTSAGTALVLDVRDRQIDAAHRIVSFRDLTHLRLTQMALGESNDRLAEILRHSNDAVLTLDALGACLDANPAALALFERHPAQLRGWGFAATMGRGIFPQNDPFPQALRAGVPLEFPHGYDRPGRAPLRLECKAVPVVSGGITVGAYVIAKDVTDQIRLRDVMARQAERTHALYLIFATRAAAEDLQIEAALQLALRSFEAHGGFIAEVADDELIVLQTVGAEIAPVGHRFPLEHTYAADAMRTCDVFTVDDFENASKRGGIERVGWRSYIVAPLPPQTGFRGVVGLASRRPVHYSDHDREFMRMLVSLLGSLIERQSQKQRLAHLAYHDHLTGLPNRTNFMRTLADAVARARAGGAGFALHFIDLDGFKALNDSGGHHAGDLALREVSRRLVMLAQGDDVAARLGGDEFVLLQSGVEDSAQAEKAGAHIVAVLSQPYIIDGITQRMGASVGFALFGINGCDGPTLLRNADRALYRAKATGKGRVVYADPDTADTHSPR